MKYIIVKYVQLANIFPGDDNACQYGYTLDDSCHDTYSGIKCGIKPSYDSLDEAKIAHASIMDVNPCGYYGVVEISD